ncbi:hypothetical protein FACS1894172_20900 [Spirochaetia bacterium]|nr:hypothetical protein FACS1894164_20910 [Spirochaetia bacterium]GHU37481.1 hypothetical protein FACS1894172_20900 [Spirochaetia bacterium]
MKTTKKRNKLFLVALLGMVLALGLVLGGCSACPGDGKCSSTAAEGGTYCAEDSCSATQAANGKLTKGDCSC